MFPLLLRTGFVGLVISGLAFHGAGRLTEARVRAAKARVDAECRAFRAAPENDRATVCSVDAYAPPVLPTFKRGEQRLEQARAAIARGDAEQARALIDEVIDVAVDLERRRTLIAALTSSKLVDKALDLAEDSAGVLDARALAARAPRWSLEHPLETERLTQMFLFSQAEREMPVGGPLADLYIADQITQRDVRLSAMQRAALAGDRARCARVTSEGYEETLCRLAADLAKRGQRLRALAPVPAGASGSATATATAPAPASASATAPASATAAAGAPAATCAPAPLAFHLHVGGRERADDILSIPVPAADTSTRPGGPPRR